MKLSRDAAALSIDPLAAPLQMEMEKIADGILAVVNENMRQPPACTSRKGATT
jgi:hypothetical protein